MDRKINEKTLTHEERLREKIGEEFDSVKSKFLENRPIK